MNRAGAILIPLLAGFLFTVAAVSWRSGWWQRSAAGPPATADPRVEARPPHLRVVEVHVMAPAAAAAAEAAGASVPAAPGAQPEPDSASLEAAPVPRVDPGSSPELLEAPARKFAHGSDSGGD